MAPSNAFEYFKELQGETDLFARLSGYVDASEPVFETEWLDFKGCKKLDHKTILIKWAEALSGFGNTAGGVIVWGLDARKDRTTGIDSVNSLSLSPNVALLEQTLRQALHSACDPPIGGVEFLQAQKPGSDEGCLVAYIPEGSIKPHRAEIGGKEFHLRVGDSFIIPNVSILRSMFYSKQSPYLVPRITTAQRGKGSTFWMELNNRGDATAEGIFIRIEYPRSERIDVAEIPPVNGLNRIPGVISLPITNTIHPGMFSACVTLCHGDRERLTLLDLDGKPLRFTVRIFCRDTQPRDWQLSIDHYMVIAPQQKEFAPIAS